MIISVFITLLFFVLSLVFQMLKGIFRYCSENKKLGIENLVEPKNRIRIFFFNLVVLVSSIGYYLVIDIFGGKDQPFAIFLIVSFTLLIQIYLYE